VQFSLTWLRDYVDLGDDVPALVHRLTMAGLPVERVTTRAEIPESVVVARVLEAKPHPNADRLRVCRVDAGNGEPLSVVCGAPNARSGMLAVLAPVGTVLPGGLKIKKSKIRGEVSEGMLCAEDELGLGDDHEGIIELAGGEPGQRYRDLCGPPETILEVEVTSNRSDCMSHYGLAREIAGLTGAALTRPESAPPEAGPPAAAALAVSVEDFIDCPRYLARIVRGVKIEPSPAWLVRRLESAGQRSINNVVDITNFVLLETGQPLHAFDLATIRSGRILVRRARVGETLTTLDGTPRKLDPDILVITDGDVPVALAGVMGGADTEITGGTTDILLESAAFRPGRVLKGSRKLRLETEAALRFRRGVDPHGAAWAADRAARLMAELAGGTVDTGVVDVCAPGLLDPRRISLRPERVRGLLGEPVADDDIAGRLEALGFGVTRAGAEWPVAVPGWRGDVQEECDLIEEVGRHLGYDAIRSRDYNAGAVSAPPQAGEIGRRRVSSILRGLGFHEALTRVLVPVDAAVRAGLDAELAGAAACRVLDPPSREEEALRVSLLPSLLGVIGHNVRHGLHEVRVFEVGKTFASRGPGELPEETAWVALAAAGGEFSPSRERSQRAFDFLDFKGHVEALCAGFQIDDARWRAYTGGGLTPSGALELTTGGSSPGFSSLGFSSLGFSSVGVSSLGFAWEADARTRDRYEIKRPVYLAQIRLGALLRTGAGGGSPAHVQYRETSRFPAIKRDLALVVPQRITHEELRERLRSVTGKLLESVELFDHYRGRHIPDGCVGLGYSLTFRASDRTLAEDEVDAAVQRVVKDLETAGIRIRDH